MRHAAIRILSVAAVMTLSCVMNISNLSSGGVDAVAYASNVPACSGNVFWGAWVGRNGATGSLIFNIAFINDGPSACRLSGYPTVQGYKNGREYPLKTARLKDLGVELRPTVLAPRMSAEMVITTMDDCNALNTGGQTAIKRVIARDTYPAITVKFPGSNYPINIYGLVLDVACGLNVSAMGWT